MLKFLPLALSFPLFISSLFSSLPTSSLFDLLPCSIASSSPSCFCFITDFSSVFRPHLFLLYSLFFPVSIDLDLLLFFHLPCCRFLFPSHCLYLSLSLSLLNDRPSGLSQAFLMASSRAAGCCYTEGSDWLSGPAAC